MTHSEFPSGTESMAFCREEKSSFPEVPTRIVLLVCNFDVRSGASIVNFSPAAGAQSIATASSRKKKPMKESFRLSFFWPRLGLGNEGLERGIRERWT